MQKLIKELIEKNVLANITNSPLKRTNGVIVVACGDGDRFPELYDHEKTLVEKSGSKRIHELLLNGGVLQMNPESPLNRDGSCQVLIGQLIEAVELKGIKDIALYAHYECGAAKLFGFSNEDYFKWLMKAEEFVVEQLEQKFGTDNGIRIATKLHYESEDGVFRTYIFDSTKWQNREEKAHAAQQL